MKRFDRFLVSEFLLFSLLGLITIIIIYDLIRLIDLMNYFLRYKATLLQILAYYFYELPAATGLLLPVGCAMGIFLTFGRLIRSNELVPLLASGVDILRIFATFLVTASVITLAAFSFNELVATKSKTRFIEYKEANIEKRSSNRTIVIYETTYLSETGRLYSIHQLNIRDSTASGWMIWEFGPKRSIKRTLRIEHANYSQKEGWRGDNIEITSFDGDEVGFEKINNGIVPEIKETPGEIGGRIKQVDEMTFIELAQYIKRRTNAGIDASEEITEFHFRFSGPLIILIVTLISISAASLLRKSNITLGIGLGLLLSFIYWGSIQAFRAFGYNSDIPGWLAAWLPNILFLGVSLVLLTKIKR